MACKPNNRETITVVIGNLTKAQRLAIEDLFATWMQLASMGASRWTNFNADGDGNFHPQITVDSLPPKPCDLTDRKQRWRDDMYWLDFDEIAWKLPDMC